MKKLRRIAAVAMACVMFVATALVGNAYAQEPERSGKAGKNSTWTLAEDGTLTISGTGSMDSFYFPWSLRNEVKQTIIQDGITNVFGFYWFENMTKVTLPNNLTEIADEAFFGCSSLPEVTVPGSVTKIGWYAFYGNKSLTKLSLPNSLIEIEYKAFENCSSLPEVTIPGNVKKIGEAAFSDCTSLKKVQLSNNVTTIAYETFNNCSSLPEVTIPYSVKSIEGRAFDGCKSLATVNFEGDAPKIDENAFKGVTATVYYPLENSTWTDEIKQNFGGNLTWVAKSLKESLAIVPESTDTEYTVGSDKGVTIKSSGPLKYFTGITFGGKVLTEADYTLDVANNSIIISAKFLSGLAAGDYEISLNYTYGSVKTVLKIQDKTAAVEENTKTIVSANPKTADESHTMVWIIGAMLSAGCLCLVIKKKRKFN